PWVSRSIDDQGGHSDLFHGNHRIIADFLSPARFSRVVESLSHVDFVEPGLRSRSIKAALSGLSIELAALEIVDCLARCNGQVDVRLRMPPDLQYVCNGEPHLDIRGRHRRRYRDRKCCFGASRCSEK